MSNTNLRAAKTAKADEFYTQLEDIERELKHYRAFFSGKTVYCNCDDYRQSNFVRYFKENFEELGLKKLFVSGYEITPYGVDKSKGDFRSPECIELLKQADIVVTNPPFSLFREYVAQLIQYKKFFVILGNKNAITYKEVFPLIMKNKIGVGYTPMGKNLLFTFPEKYKQDFLNNSDGGSRYRIVDNKMLAQTAAIWYTNIPLKKQNEGINLVQEYSPEKYPHYDNYDAIEVSKTAQIPCNYFGVMGVPITFLDKYNPAQFEILGCTAVYGDCGVHVDGTSWNAQINGKKVYKRLFIRRRQGLKNTNL